MPLIDISPVGSFGIISDLAPHELAPEAWSAGNCVRMIEGAVETIKGNSSVYGTPSVPPYWALNVITPNQQYWIYAGLNNVYDTDGSTHTLISALGGYNASADINWSGALFNGVPILNNGVERPQMQAPAQRGTQLTDLLNWPGTLRARVLRAFDNFLVALDTLDGTIRNPYNVRWSDPAGPGAVPGSWNIADPTTRAGERTIAESGGFVIDCLPLGSINYIYKEDRIWGMRFIGGTFVFQFGELFRGKGGILSRRCVGEFNKRHLVVTRGDVMVHDGNSIDSIVDTRQRRRIFSIIDESSSQRTFVYPNYQKNEMWICIPEQGHSLATRIFAWNWNTNTWGEWQIGDLSVGEPAGIAHIAEGLIETTPAPVIDAVDIIIDQDLDIIDGSRLNPSTPETLMLRPNPQSLIQAETAVTSLQLPEGECYIERTGLTLTGRSRSGAPKVDMNRVKFLRGIIPRFSSATEPVNVRAGYQDYPGGPITWSADYPFDPSTDRIAPFLNVSGKLLAVRFSSPTTTARWKLEGYQLDIELGGTA